MYVIRTINMQMAMVKLFGGIQIGIGALCVLIGAVDLVLFVHYNSHYCDDNIKRLSKSGVPIWCGIWFIAAGTTGICMFVIEKAFPLLRLAFVILSMLSGVLFGPAVCSSEAYLVYKRKENAESSREWLLPSLLAIFSFFGIIFALVSTFFTCLCNKTKAQKVQKDREPSPASTNGVYGKTSETSRLIGSELVPSKRARVEIQTPISENYGSAHSKNRTRHFLSNNNFNKSQLSNSTSNEEWWHSRQHGQNEPPRLWRPWQRGIPDLAKAAQVSLAWRNKVNFARNNEVEN